MVVAGVFDNDGIEDIESAEIEESNIDPEDVIAWLITQPNTTGTLFRESVVRRYMRSIQLTPRRLDITLKNRNVFAINTVLEFDHLCEIFKAAQNYTKVNRNAGHGEFSAGLAAYRRYLVNLECGNSIAPVEKMDESIILVSEGRKVTDVTVTSDVNSTLETPTNVPNKLINIINSNYASGFRFETTYINLISNASSVEVDEKMQLALKRMMFQRDDGIYFLLDTVADATTRKEIVNFADFYLHEYGCFEISQFYKQYVDKVNSACIRNADDFEIFYEQIGKSGVRCVQAPYIGNRIARFSHGNVWGTFKEIAAKIVSVISEEYYGLCNEDDLHAKFCAFSTDLLGKIIKQCAADNLTRVEINDSVCYQTYDALGLPDDFSEQLAETLNRLADIGLNPSQEVLHTAISLKLGANFMEEFNLPDWDTYRRLVASFYKTEPRREWKYNIFGEVEK